MNELAHLNHELSYHQFNTVYDPQNTQTHTREALTIQKKLATITPSPTSSAFTKALKTQLTYEGQIHTLFPLLFKYKETTSKSPPLSQVIPPILAPTPKPTATAPVPGIPTKKKKPPTIIEDEEIVENFPPPKVRKPRKKKQIDKLSEITDLPIDK